MRGRKTVSIDDLRNRANLLLECTGKTTSLPSMATKEFKEGVCVMLELALHTADRYEGFRYLDSENCQYDSVGYWSRKYY